MDKYGEVYLNASLEKYNTYGIITYAKYLVKPTSKENLKELVKYLNDNNIPYYVLGKGSNVILPDDNFSGAIISLEKLNDITIKENIVNSEAGVLLSKLVSTCINNNLAGLEHFMIPGTLGGALFGNASFLKDTSIYDNIVNVTVLREGKIITLNKSDIKLSYRYSSFKENNDIILAATFALTKGNKEEMQREVEKDALKRKNTQPLEYKNAGSVFKNPEGVSAGKLIDELGLKGYHIGDAEVSMKHANFIINKGHATSKDIKKLINVIKEEVKNKYNIELELEQRIIEW